MKVLELTSDALFGKLLILFSTLFASYFLATTGFHQFPLYALIGLIVDPWGMSPILANILAFMFLPLIGLVFGIMSFLHEDGKTVTKYAVLAGLLSLNICFILAYLIGGFAYYISPEGKIKH
jgi:hypothetical protein